MPLMPRVSSKPGRVTPQRRGRAFEMVGAVKRVAVNLQLCLRELEALDRKLEALDRKLEALDRKLTLRKLTRPEQQEAASR